MDESTANFLRRLNEQNAAIAAREAEREEATRPDQVRLQREQERREKYGELRAREHRGNRPKQVHNVFGHVDTSEY